MFPGMLRRDISRRFIIIIIVVVVTLIIIIITDIGKNRLQLMHSMQPKN